MGQYYKSLSVAAAVMISNKCPIITKQVVVIFMTSLEFFLDIIIIAATDKDLFVVPTHRVSELESAGNRCESPSIK